MTEETLHRFDRYLKKEMTPEEVKSFLIDLEGDHQLTAEFESYQLSVKAIQESGNSKLKAVLEDIHSEQVSAVEETKVVPMNRLRWVYAAAVILALVASTLWIASESSTPQSLYAEHFDVYSGPSNTRGEQGEANFWDRFAAFYANQAYEECTIMLAEAELDEVEPEYLIRFYSGVCAMALDEPDFSAALRQLQEVVVVDNDYHAQAKWYMALCYLGLDKPLEAKKVLEDLKTSSTYKSEEVDQLLGDL